MELDGADDDDDGFAASWSYGESYASKKKLKAGTAYTLHVEMQYRKDAELAKDFSVILQGETGGAITITHSKGLKTAKLPAITRKAK